MPLLFRTRVSVPLIESSVIGATVSHSVHNRGTQDGVFDDLEIKSGSQITLFMGGGWKR